MAYVQYSLTISESQVNKSIWLGGGVMVTDDFFTEVWVNTTPIGNKKFYQFPTAGTYIIRCFLKDETCIKQMCFSNCEMTDVIIPNTVKRIEDGAFNTCLNLKTVLFEENSQLTIIEGSVFTSCFKLELINFPNTLRRIGAQAFGGCDSLKSIQLPYSLITIEARAFDSCANLNYIQCLGNTAPIITNTTFDRVASNGLLVYPEGSDYSQWLSTEPYNLGYYGWRSGTHGDGQDTPMYPNGTITSSEGYKEVGGSGEIFNYIIESTDIQWWKVTNSFSWINVEGDNGSYSITVNGNTDTIDREASIKFAAYDYNGNVLYHTLTIYQEAKAVEPEPDEPTPPTEGESYLTGTPRELYFHYDGTPKDGDEITVEWYGEYAYWEQYTVNKKWASLTEINSDISDYRKITTYKLSIEENPDNVERQGTIYFKGTLTNGKNFVLVVTYYQDAKPEEPEPDVPPTPEEPTFEISPSGRIDISADGGQIQITTTEVNISEVSYDVGDNWLSVQKKDGYYLLTVEANNTEEERHSEVYFIGIPVGEYDVTKLIDRIIYVHQDAKAVEPEPDEPDVPPTPDEPDEPTEPEVPYVEPEIRLYKTRLDYSSEGGEQRVQIDYYGATKILEPTCSQSWVTIQKTQSGYYEEDGVRVDQHQYKITMASSKFSRNTSVTFSCTDVNGKVFKDSHLTLYQAAPVADPTIVVSKNQMSFDNVGDTNTVQVTYINVSDIVPPTVDEGFTIEEIERVESEDGIQIKYQIKRVSAKGQNASINFQGSNSEGKTTTSKDVTLKGEPVPATVEVDDIFPSKNGVFYIRKDGNDSEIRLKVYNPTAPYEMKYVIKDEKGVVSCIDTEVIDYIEDYGELIYEYQFDCLPNNTNEPFTGTIEFNYTDALTNTTLSVPFYIGSVNEGEVRVNVNSYNFDKDGNRIDMSDYMYIEAHYIKISSTNEPVVDVDWLHLEEGEIKDYKDWVNGEYIVVGHTYKHNFTVDSNDGPARRGIITFSGKGIDGKDYSFVLELNQEGNDTVKPIDEGFIELQQLSVYLMADGGAQTFQVKYYDARDIFAPELEYDWATITEVSRTEPVPDVAWNGEECDSVMVTYKVTANPTESGRQMKVKFKSDINYYDGGVVHMEKDNFIIYQLAEGSTEVQGLVSILRYSKSFTYFGSPTGWDFRVAYKDVTPDTPIISESWCRVEEVKDLRADEYDYYKEYILDMDENKSPISRTCTITFIGNCEDGTQIKTPFQFVQQGQEEVYNEGEYDNYKGYFMDFEGTTHSISFITNPRFETYGDIRLAGDSPVVVSYSENSELYSPIRTSTCTVRVVSSHYLMNLYTGKAQGTQVILKNEDRGTIEWCGFLQPNLYNQGFSNCVEEIEFEASDCLSVLQYLKYEYYYMGNGQPMIVSFKDIVDSIADKSKLINDYRFTQKLFSNSDESKIFDFKEFYISENNFYSEEGEPWTYQEVLEETCKYFGYVCFQWGDKLYFMDYDKYQSNNSMVGYEYSKEDRWINRKYITISNPNQITEESYRGTGADISLDDVFNKVSVNCNYYNVENVIPDLFEDDNLIERNGISITTLANRGQEIGSRTDYIVYDHKNIISHFYKPVINDNYHEIETTPTEEEFNKKTFFRDFVGGNIVDMYHLDYGDVSGRSYESKEWEKYLMISQLNRPWCAGGGTWETYNLPIMEFTQLPQIFIDNHKEVYESTSTGSTGGRVPSTGSSSGNVVPRSTTSNRGFGSSSSTPHDRNANNSVINVNKCEHFLIISAEAAFTPNFKESYVPEGVDQTGFNKWSNKDYGGFTFDSIKGASKDGYSFNPALTFYLEIPQAGWWDGSKWVDNETYFEVPLDALHYTNEVWYTFKNTKNTVQTTLFLGKAGYKIPLPEQIESTAFMQFKIGMPKRFAHVTNNQGGDNKAEGGNAYCFIKSLEMNIVTRNTSLMKDDDIIFENVIDDGNVIEGPEIDLKITSDNNITYSFSTVSTKYGEDMINTTNFRFYDMEGELILPEEAIVERYVNQYSTPTLKENVTVDMSFTPAQMITDTYWGNNKSFVITAQEIDYKQCSQQITLLEKK